MGSCASSTTVGGDNTQCKPEAKNGETPRASHASLATDGPPTTTNISFTNLNIQGKSATILPLDDKENINSSAIPTDERGPVAKSPDPAVGPTGDGPNNICPTPVPEGEQGPITPVVEETSDSSMEEKDILQDVPDSKDEQPPDTPEVEVAHHAPTEDASNDDSVQSSNDNGNNSSVEVNESEIAQSDFDTAIRCSCAVVNPETVTKFCNLKVRKIQLLRSLPPSFSLNSLLGKLSGLQEVDVSGNQLGPQAFRALLLSLCHNNTITVLSVANNMADTDSATAVGKMLTSNQILLSLDVSGNYLGKDFFSRNVGPALKLNKSLQTLKCEGIGSTDLSVFMDGAKTNLTLQELYLSHNEMSKPDIFATGLAEWLKNARCSLQVLEMKNCGLKGAHLDQLGQALSSNSNLCVLNVGGNECPSSSSLMNLMVSCLGHENLRKLCLDDMKISQEDEWTTSAKLSKASPLQQLSMVNCKVKDTLFDALVEIGANILPDLGDLVLTNNPGITVNSLISLQTLIKGSGAPCNIMKLSFGLNDSEAVPAFLSSGPYPKLRYLNLRKSRLSADSIGALSQTIKNCGLEVLVLDGIKLAGSKSLPRLMDWDSSSSLVALSLSSCQLSDRDLLPLAEALTNGVPINMMKLSANRIGDEGLGSIVGALMKSTSHPIKLMDLSNNKIGSEGAEKLCSLLTNKQHQSQLRSINLSSNSIGPSGVKALVSLVGKTSLTSLQVYKQDKQFECEDMDEIFNQVAETLDLKLEKDGDSMKTFCCDLPTLPPGFGIRLDMLGGDPGELGQFLECAAIATDFRSKCLPYLCLQHILEMASAFKGSTSGNCLLSQLEWNDITGAEKEAPSWLMVGSHRNTAIYLSHLPASITVPKMEGFLENEADCNVQEVFLMKDPVSRKNNGLAWVLLADEGSVDRAVKLYENGEAKVFGQSFVISRVNVEINDEASSHTEAKAKSDMAARLEERTREAIAHRTLIQESYITSQERHAYRLAHPAYADGRIW